MEVWADDGFVELDHIDGMVDGLRLALRVTGEAYDPEIRMLCASAVEDMLRVGVPASYVGSDPTPARVQNAITCYVKSHFGFDNPDAERLDMSYRQIVVDMLNSALTDPEPEERP